MKNKRKERFVVFHQNSPPLVANCTRVSANDLEERARFVRSFCTCSPSPSRANTSHSNIQFRASVDVRERKKGCFWEFHQKDNFQLLWSFARVLLETSKTTTQRRRRRRRRRFHANKTAVSLSLISRYTNYPSTVHRKYTNRIFNFYSFFDVLSFLVFSSRRLCNRSSFASVSSFVNRAIVFYLWYVENVEKQTENTRIKAGAKVEFRNTRYCTRKTKCTTYE